MTIRGLAMKHGGLGLDKAALTRLADTYVEALVARDPSRLTLSREVRFTENGQSLELGQALWRTASGKTDYRIDVADPQAGQICTLTMVLENDRPTFLSVRLKATPDGAISEIETLAGRQGHGTPDRPRRLDAADPLLSQPLRPEERSSRERMLEIADSYFAGLSEPGVRPPIDARCDRFENGVQTTNLADAGASWAARSCEDQYHAGFSKIVETNKDRRYPTIDEDLGLVYAQVVMQFTGAVLSVEISDGSTFTPPDRYLQPRALLAHEIFKISAGQIRRLESMYVVVPYGSSSGW